MPDRLPQDRTEAALVYFGLIRAYGRLAEAAAVGNGADENRQAIESEVINSLAGAAASVDATVRAEVVAAAQGTLKRLFDEVSRARAT